MADQENRMSALAVIFLSAKRAPIFSFHTQNIEQVGGRHPGTDPFMLLFDIEDNVRGTGADDTHERLS